MGSLWICDESHTGIIIVDHIIIYTKEPYGNMSIDTIQHLVIRNQNISVPSYSSIKIEKYTIKEYTRDLSQVEIMIDFGVDSWHCHIKWRLYDILYRKDNTYICSIDKG